MLTPGTALASLNGMMKRDWRVPTVRLGLVGRIGLILLLLLASAAPAAAAINLLTSAKAAGTNIGAASPWYLQVDVSTPGNSTVVVAVAVKNTAVIPSSVTDSGGSLYVLLADQIVNVSSARVQLWSTVAAGAKNSTWVRVNTCCTGTDMVAAVASYSGVVSLGKVVKAFTATASTTPSVSVTTSDANNWVVAAMATAGNLTIGSSTGNLRQSAIANATVGGALMDNTSATPAAVSNTLTVSNPGQYTAMAAVELRTAPGIYIIGSSSSQNGGGTTCNAGTAVAGGTDLVGKVNVVIVAVGSSSASVSTVQENTGNSGYTKRAFLTAGAARIEIWTAPVALAASGSVIATLSANVKAACALGTYVGVAGFGSTTTASGTNANPSTAALTTQDPNNVVVGGFAWTGTAASGSSCGTGTLRQTAAATTAAVALCDNTSTTTASVTTQATHVSGQWAAAALELRATRSSWNYTTGGANMAPPALDPWNNIVVAGSNDNKLHVLADTDGLQKFAPFAGAAGPIASRPTVIPASYSTKGLNIGYFGSQDGYVYAVNTATGTQVWKSALLPTTGGMVQGGVGIGLKAGGLAITNDLIFAGTSNVSSDVNYKTDNKVYALDGNLGTTTWTFNPGNMDIISSTPYVDYVNNAVWVTSRSNSNAQPSVWKLRATDGFLLASWSKVQSGTALGDIDSAPNGSADGSVVYVGTNGGTINAIKAGASYTGLDPAGSIVTYTPVSTAPCSCTGVGTVKMPWWLSFSAISGGSPDTIIFSRNATVHSVSFNGTTFTANWTVTPTGAPTSVSGPVDDGVNTYIFVGGSDGKVHQIQQSNGTDTKQLPVSAATPTLGEPTFNGDLNLLYIGGTDGRTYTFQVPLP